MSRKKFGKTILYVKKARGKKYVYWRRENESHITCLGTVRQVLMTMALYLRVFPRGELSYFSLESTMFSFLRAFGADNLVEFFIHVTRGYDDFISILWQMRDFLLEEWDGD